MHINRQKYKAAEAEARCEPGGETLRGGVYEQLDDTESCAREPVYGECRQEPALHVKESVRQKKVEYCVPKELSAGGEVEVPRHDDAERGHQSGQKKEHTEECKQQWPFRTHVSIRTYMPPNEDTMGVQKSSGAGRGFFWFFTGLVVGAALIIVGAYFALHNTAFQNWLRNYFVSVSIQQFSQISTSTPPTQNLQSFATASTTIAVPKAYASLDYYTALNSVYFDYNNMVAVGGQIAPLFAKLNTQTASGDYGGVIDLAVQIKQLIAKEKDIANSFGQHLVSLSVANQATKDPVTKTLTQDLISTGNTFREGVAPYFDALDGIFSGKPPSSEDIAHVTVLAQRTTENLLAFKAKFQLVLNHFKDAASATPAQ